MTRARSVPEIKMIGWGFLLNGLWEFLQSPLYADHEWGTIYVLWSRLHCTGGDVLILLGAYWITSLMFRTRSWPTDNSYVFATLKLSHFSPFDTRKLSHPGLSPRMVLEDVTSFGLGGRKGCSTWWTWNTFVN